MRIAIIYNENTRIQLVTVFVTLAVTRCKRENSILKWQARW